MKSIEQISYYIILNNICHDINSLFSQLSFSRHRTKALQKTVTGYDNYVQLLLKVKEKGINSEDMVKKTYIPSL